MTPIGLSIQKGLPASIAARAISWCKKLGEAMEAAARRGETSRSGKCSVTLA